MTESVKVAVRVRPFIEREKKTKAELIIGMDGATTTIKNPNKPQDTPKKFTFDYSYWSHDGFTTTDDGYLKPEDPKFADQDRVFQDLGRGVLQNAWDGYNTTLFAYGQTGSGKSYSIVGYDKNKGIVPLACDELFQKIEQKRAENGDSDEFQVFFGMLEIYNEQVRDLLNSKSKESLQITRDPKRGFYAKNAKSVPVTSYQEISKFIGVGTKNRTIASTKMNETSSRAHTIVSISFKQISTSSGKSMTKSSIINLVDLAGSERASKSGATGDRLKEGSNINKSLSTLGRVIKALASKEGHVPYRDSVLTKLLENALGGNSKTIMIAALSPADCNYEETLSTLRFADRAKSIKTKATVNESPTDKLIRELKEENARLLKLLEEGGLDQTMLNEMTGSDGSPANQAEIERIKAEMEAEVRKNEEEMEEMKKSWEEKMKEQQKEYQGLLEAKNQEDEKKKTVPYLWNLNEDPTLSGMITHFCPQGKTTVGRRTNEKADIKLNGVGASEEHAMIENSKDIKLTLKPMKESKVFLNGNEIKEEKEIHHNDIIIFGSGRDWYVLHHPKSFEKMKKEKRPTTAPTFEKAEELLAINSGQDITGLKEGSKEYLLLQEDLIQIWPMMCEANAMSEELNKKVKFEIDIISPQARGLTEGRSEVKVKMTDMKTRHEFILSRDDFEDRKFLMQDMYHNFQEGIKDWDKQGTEDPFFEDPSTAVLIGIASIYMQPLAHKFDVRDKFRIINYRGNKKGKLSVELYPCDETGTTLAEDDICDNPSELVGSVLSFKIKILKANDIPKRFKQCYARYQLTYMADGGEGMTAERQGSNPDFEYERVHTFKAVTPDTLHYLEHQPLIIEFWGRQAPCEDRSGNLTTRELMLRDPVHMQGGVSIDDEAYRRAAEANTLKKRIERSQIKLRKIGALYEEAKKDDKTTVEVEDLDIILRGGKRFKAVANTVLMVSRNKSQACVLQ